MLVAEPLDDDDLDRKEEYVRQGFPDWSRRDFQQLVRGLETNGWCGFTLFQIDLILTFVCRDASPEQLAVEIQDKNADDVTAYLKVFLKKCKTLSGA
jgi:SWI/SNF-related matrix-associated actin-dependent regulator of chromatin subfamily A member 5